MLSAHSLSLLPIPSVLQGEFQTYREDRLLFLRRVCHAPFFAVAARKLQAELCVQCLAFLLSLTFLSMLLPEPTGPFSLSRIPDSGVLRPQITVSSPHVQARILASYLLLGLPGASSPLGNSFLSCRPSCFAHFHIQQGFHDLERQSQCSELPASQGRWRGFLSCRAICVLLLIQWFFQFNHCLWAAGGRGKHMSHPPSSGKMGSKITLSLLRMVGSF